MKKFTLSFFVSIVVLQGGLYAQHYSGAAAKEIYSGASYIIKNPDLGNISFVRLDPQLNISESSVENWLRSDILKLRAEDGMIRQSDQKDRIGFNHLRYRQSYKGVPVEYGMYNVHCKNGQVVSASGAWYSGLGLGTKPSIAEAVAYNIAVNYVNAEVYRHDFEEKNNNRLLILPQNGSFKLVYKCNVMAAKPFKQVYLYIDAHTGAIVKEENAIITDDVIGTAETAYTGIQKIVTDSFGVNSYRLRDYTRGSGIETYDYLTSGDLVDADNYWDFTGALNDYANDAHFGVEATYDWYDIIFDWQSVDGNGSTKLISYINNNGAGSINAFWDPTGQTMNYGQGDIPGGVTPLTSLEVCGHELTHGVTQNSSGLDYFSPEPGALNESFSDIAGIAIRFKNLATATWLLGDQFNYVLRDMSNPNLYNCADTYGGTFWNNGDIVHFNSGVQNFWFYLLVEGGSGINDNGDAYSVIGIGLDDASNIALGNNLFYLSPQSDFQDSRDMSIQRAIDIYGDCSPQVIQTTNAWYAVGVGGLYANAVTANFTTPQFNFCTVPTTVQFTNTSFNGTDFLWDFGDGTTSTDVSPSHTYTDEGVFTVSLIVNGVSLCNTSDTMIKVDYINIQNVGQPQAASCIPVTTSPSTGYGIFKVALNTINKSSLGSTEGYQDFSCSDFTFLIAGDPYILSVNTGPGKSEDLRVWIDYDNDGAFNNSNELVFLSDQVQDLHTGILYTSASAVLNTPLRMRIIDDKAANTITDACYNPQQGQAEDYSLIFLPVTTAPVADFIADQTNINFGQAINFFDLSANGPTSWSWSFEGGTPATSTLQNPTSILYDQVGVYDVTLTVTNSFGSDTITKVDYITVNPVFNICTIDTVTLETGTFYDTGGPSAKYSNNESCTLLISPPCAASITVNFSSFATSSASDVLKIYDGPDANAPLILSASGFPFPLPSATGTSGQLFITWNSDNLGVSSGYAASYTSIVGGTVTPVASFIADNLNPPLNVDVNFSDQSTNNPIHWGWDFGDGGTSTLKNPSHAYATPGNYVVTMIASNCGGTDTSSLVISVQEAPIMVVEPDSLVIYLSCGIDSATVPVTIFNNGGGDLVYNPTELEYNFQGDKPHVLALTYGADMSGPYQNTIDAIDQYWPDYTLSTINTTDGGQLADALVGKNVCLITKPVGFAPDYINFAAPLQDFVTNGGTVIFCGAASSKIDCIFNTGLLSGTFGLLANGNPLDVVNTSSPITQGIGSQIDEAPKNTYSVNFTSDVQSLIEYLGETVVGYRDYGFGHVVYLGFDYKVTNDSSGIVIGNTFSWVNSLLVGDWLTFEPIGSGVVSGSGQQVLNITVTNDGLEEGNYSEYIIVTGNDLNNPVDTILCTVIVSMEDCYSFQAIMGCEGQVCFNDSVIGTGTTVSWDFGDGTTSTQSDPCHTYANPGTYTVQLIGCGSFGCDTIMQVIDISILEASIQYSPVVAYAGDPVSFTSNSSGAISYLWDFGDGNISTLQDPDHTYASDGVYTVTLTVTDANLCGLTTTEIINILPTGIAEPTGLLTLEVFPNPFNNQAYIQFDLSGTSNVSLELLNGIGQKISILASNEVLQKGKHTYPIEVAEAGIYMIRCSIGDEVIWKKVVKIN